MSFVQRLFGKNAHSEANQLRKTDQNVLRAQALLAQGADSFQQGRIQDSLREIQESLRIYPDSAVAHFNLA